MKETIREDDVREPFSEYGRITDVKIVNKETYSFGFVTYETHDQA